MRQQAKVNKAHLDTLFTINKEKEPDLLSRGGRHVSRANRITQERPCYVCGSSDHVKRECKQKCKHCQKTGQRHKECYSLQNHKKTKDDDKSKARSKSRAKKPADNKKKPDSKNNRVDSESKEEKDSFW